DPSSVLHEFGRFGFQEGRRGRKTELNYSPGVHGVRTPGWDRWASVFFRVSERSVAVNIARAIEACLRAARARILRRVARSLNAVDSARNHSAWARRRRSVVSEYAIPTL